MVNKIKTKNCAGIIYVDKYRNEILLVQRKYTYAFSDIIFNKYNIDGLDYIISKITPRERLLLFNLNFNECWINIWGFLYKTDFYYMLKKKFEENFILNFDNRDLLRKYINKYEHNNNKLPWEFPKGRQEKNESFLGCAIRELKEETSIDLYETDHSFISMFNIKRKVNDIIYSLYYYLVYADRQKICKNNEINDVQWFSLDDYKEYIEDDLKFLYF